MTKHILQIERVRRVPAHFSWVDHRLLRMNYLPRASAPGWALYLVLVTAGDEHGLSYYSDKTLGRLLSMSIGEVQTARRELMRAGVIAYEAPLCQVLGLEGGMGKEERP